LAQRIAEVLEKRIISQTLKPGERIIEEDICKSFGVSRSPVREAIMMLKNRGFIVHEARKGASVARITKQEAEDIFRIRACLDSLASSLSAAKRTPRFMRKLNKIHKQMILSAEEGNLASYQNLNDKFHELIINACGNERLIQLIVNFEKQTEYYRRITQSNGFDWLKDSRKTHAEIMAAFEKGDPEEVGNIRKEVILGQIPRFSDYEKEG